MRGGEVSAVIVQVVNLFAVVGQWIAGNLSAGNAATVSEHGKKERIYAAAFLKDVEHLFGGLIHEGNRSYLNANHFFARRNGCVSHGRHG